MKRHRKDERKLNPFAGLARAVLERGSSILMVPYRTTGAGRGCGTVWMLGAHLTWDQGLRTERSGMDAWVEVVSFLGPPEALDNHVSEVVGEWRKTAARLSDPVVALHVLAGGAP